MHLFYIVTFIKSMTRLNEEFNFLDMQKQLLKYVKPNHVVYNTLSCYYTYFERVCHLKHIKGKNVFNVKNLRSFITVSDLM